MNVINKSTEEPTEPAEKQKDALWAPRHWVGKEGAEQDPELPLRGFCPWERIWIHAAG